jgi:hypothetical protein
MSEDAGSGKSRDIEKAKKKKNPRFYNKNYSEDLHMFESDEDQIKALMVETGLNFD